MYKVGHDIQPVMNKVKLANWIGNMMREAESEAVMVLTEEQKEDCYQFACETACATFVWTSLRNRFLAEITSEDGKLGVASVQGCLEECTDQVNSCRENFFCRA